jgi:5'(3')-deoxyribonucleotidase
MKYIKKFKLNENMSGKKIVYVDMDDTLCDFTGPFKRGQQNTELSEETPNRKWPQSKVGFFTGLQPLPGSIEGMNLLMQKYDVWILTRPSIKNTHCYTEKAEWIKKYFGEQMLEKMIISPNKALVKGDYLIDDDTRHGQVEFEGEHIHFGQEKFPNWNSVIEYLM